MQLNALSVRRRGAASVKSCEYSELVAKRKKCSLCPGLTNPSRVQGGEFDSEHIGPYSQWQGSLTPDVVVVAKDFAPVSKFVEYGGKPGPLVRTNLRLRQFLETVGYSAGAPDAPDNAPLFFTNAVLCLPGGESMRTAVPDSAVRTCGSEFLAPLLQLLSPRAVVALGAKATTALFAALRLQQPASFAELVQGSGLALPSGATFLACPHPAAALPNAEHEAAWARVAQHATQQAPTAD